MPARALAAAGTEADTRHALELARGLEADAVIADKGYDSGAFAESVESSGAEAVIPPRKNRKVQREYDAFPYKLRRLVENAIRRYYRGELDGLEMGIYGDWCGRTLKNVAAAGGDSPGANRRFHEYFRLAGQCPYCRRLLHRDGETLKSQGCST